MVAGSVVVAITRVAWLILLGVVGVRGLALIHRHLRHSHVADSDGLGTALGHALPRVLELALRTRW